MKILRKLEEWKKKEFISSVEVEFVHFLQQISPNENEQVLMAAAACIHAQSKGHVCLDLGKMEQDEYLFNESETGFKVTDELKNEWISALRKSELVSSGDDLQPLVLEEGRLYLHRFWKYEEELSKWLKAKSANAREVSDKAKKALQLLLVPSGDLFEPNWQHLAVVLSFLKDLVIISGGPGTGKTYTVLNIIAAQQLAHPGEKFRIALAAPTGKAARRLINSIEHGIEKLPGQINSQLDIPDVALTVHKMLGADFRGSSFKFNEQNKLPYDMVVVDEASMLDLTMWVRLIRAIGTDTKLVVLGDKDQLASVEAGSILGDICGGENTFSQRIKRMAANITGMEIPLSQTSATINDSVVFLTKSYRFGEDSGIGTFAKAINVSDTEQALSILRDPKYPDLTWLDTSPKNMQKVMADYGVSHFEEYIQVTPEERLEASNRRKILCALRQGDYGVETLNQSIERHVRQKQGLLSSSEWYEGRIVMATRNDAMLKVRNGEIGMYREEGNLIRFEGEQALNISATRLKEYEPAFAITIHKSQGSEFEEVAIVLPNKINTILSKEILYTAVTRARQSTLIIANEVILKKTIERSVSRKSGVQQKVWSDLQ